MTVSDAECHVAPMSSSAQEQQRAFEQLIRPHVRHLYRLAFRLTGNTADAEDVLQDVLIALYQRRDELTSIADLRPWLGRVLYNRFVDSRRRNRSRRLHVVDTIENLPPSETDTEGEAHSQLDIRRVQHALQQMSDEHRHLLLLHCAEGYSLEEIQGITDTPIGTLKSRLHRARARLRQLLGGEGTSST